MARRRRRPSPARRRTERHLADGTVRGQGQVDTALTGVMRTLARGPAVGLAPAKAHPLVQTALTAFPGAEVVDVRVAEPTL